MRAALTSITTLQGSRVYIKAWGLYSMHPDPIPSIDIDRAGRVRPNSTGIVEIEGNRVIHLREMSRI